MSYALPSGHKHYILIGLGPKTKKLEGNSNMVFASVSVHLGERVSNHGCHQCLVSKTSCSCLLPLPEALQDQQLCLTQAPFKLLLLPQVTDYVRFLCAH